MAIAHDDMTLGHILSDADIEHAHRKTETLPSMVICMVIYNYAFGWDGTYPENEIDLTCWFSLDQDGYPRIEKIEDERGTKLLLPDAVIDDLEKQIDDELAPPEDDE